MSLTDSELRRVLTETKVIALVGWSPRADRASHGVARHLAGRGYKVIPVNPGQTGVVTSWGATVVASLSDIAEHVDMIDIFRNSDAVEPVVDEALLALPGLKTIWMQLGVENQTAARKAEARGLTVVMDRCPVIEIARLMP